MEFPSAATLRRWAPALAWMALISVLSSQSRLPIDVPVYAGLLHKLSHIGGWAILAHLDRYALGPSFRWRDTGAWLLATAFAAVDEWHQSFTAGRGSSPLDVALDSWAAACALLAWRAVAAWRAARYAPVAVSSAGST